MTVPRVGNDARASRATTSWTDKENEEHRSASDKKTRLASGSVGVGCSRSESVSRDMAFSGGGAALVGLFDRQGQSREGPSVEGHVLNRSPGHFDPDDADAAVGAPSRSGNADDSIRRGSFARPLRGLNPRTGSRGHVRGERPVRSPCRVVGVPRRWRSDAPLGG